MFVRTLNFLLRSRFGHYNLRSNYIKLHRSFYLKAVLERRRRATRGAVRRREPQSPEDPWHFIQ